MNRKTPPLPVRQRRCFSCLWEYLAPAGVGIQRRALLLQVPHFLLHLRHAPQLIANAFAVRGFQRKLPVDILAVGGYTIFGGRCVRVSGLLRHFYWINVIQIFFACCRSCNVKRRFPHRIFFVLDVRLPLCPFVLSVVVQPSMRIICWAALFIPCSRNQFVSQHNGFLFDFRSAIFCCKVFIDRNRFSIFVYKTSALVGYLHIYRISVLIVGSKVLTSQFFDALFYHLFAFFGGQIFKQCGIKIYANSIILAAVTNDAF